MCQCSCCGPGQLAVDSVLLSELQTNFVHCKEQSANTGLTAIEQYCTTDGLTIIVADATAAQAGAIVLALRFAILHPLARNAAAHKHTK